MQTENNIIDKNWKALIKPNKLERLLLCLYIASFSSVTNIFIHIATLTSISANNSLWAVFFFPNPNINYPIC